MTIQLDVSDPFKADSSGLDVQDPFKSSLAVPLPKLASAKPDEPGFIDSAVRGFKRALPETKSLLYGAGAAVAGGLGFDELRDSALENYQQVQKEDVEPLQSNATFSGVLDGSSSLGEWAGDTLGNFGGQALQSAAAAGAGALVGGATTAPTGPGAIVGAGVGAVGGLVAKTLVKKSVKEYVEDLITKGVAKDVAEAAAQKYAVKLGGATIAGSGLNVGQEVGISYTGRAEDAAASGEQLTKTDSARALAFGIPAGLLDTLAEGLTVGRAARGMSDSPSLVKRVIGGAGKGAVMEGSTEGVQAVLERAGANQDLTSDEAYSDYLENFAAGALGGTVAGGASGVKRQQPEGPISRAVLQMPDLDDVPPTTTVIDPVSSQPVEIPTHKPGSLSETAAILKSAFPMVDTTVLTEPSKLDQVLPVAEQAPQAATPAERVKRTGPETIDPATGEVIKLNDDDVKTRITEMLDAGTMPDTGTLAGAFNITRKQAGEYRKQVQTDRKEQALAGTENTNQTLTDLSQPITEIDAKPAANSQQMVDSSTATEPVENADTFASPIETSSAPSPSADVGKPDTYTSTVTAADDSIDVLDTDITTQSGSPFTEIKAAELMAKSSPGTKVVPVEGGFVVRKIAQDLTSLPLDDKTAILKAKQSSQPQETAEPLGEAGLAPSPALTLQSQSEGASDARSSQQLAAPQVTSSEVQQQVEVPVSASSNVTSTPTALESAAAQAATSPLNDIAQPTAAQKEAGNYKVGRLKVNGLDISIEHPAGVARKEGHQPLAHAYGYIKGTKARDKDHVDVFLGTRADDTSLPVFVVDQYTKDGKYDEPKVILGQTDEASAREAYLANYPKGWNGLGAITQMSQDEFKAWVKDPTKTVKRAASGRNGNQATDNAVESGGPVGAVTPISADVPSAAGQSKGQPSKALEIATAAQSSPVLNDTSTTTEKDVQNDAQNKQTPEQTSTQEPTTEITDEATQQAGLLERRNASERARVDALPLDKRDAEIARLRAEIRNDDLTGLLNAKAYRQDKEAGKLKPHYAMIDLDLFKGYNDILGYEGADVALKQFGSVIAKVNPTGDSYRRGGDEFVLTHDDPAELAKSVTRLKNLSARIRIRLTAKDGERMIIKGIQHSTGIGTDESTANTALAAAKGDKPSSRDGAQPSNIVREGEAGKSQSGLKSVSGKKPDRQDGDSLKNTPAKVGVPDSAPQSKIDDFGEKIAGSKKEYAAAYKDKMKSAMDVDIAAEPLSKSWPEPEYQKLLEAGNDPRVVAMVRSMRDEIPTKPKKSYRVKTWVAQLQQLRDTANSMLNDAEFAAKFFAEMEKTGHIREQLNDGVGGRAKLYEIVGHEKSLKGIHIVRGQYSVYAGITYNPAKVIWSIENVGKSTMFSNMPRRISSGDTRDAAIEGFKAAYSTLDSGTNAKTLPKFELYADRNAKAGAKGQYFIGKKVGRNVIHLKDGFDTVKEARQYLADNNDELSKILEAKKAVPNERYDVNQPRVGQDMRNAQDVTPELFRDAFGFRGVQFGNYVEGPRRQKDLNDAYDALMDMAAVLDIPPKSISLNGELGLAFGARGSGGINPASAHYEPGEIVINLTKTNGAGSLAHEWWHALDNYFSRLRGKKTSFATDALDVSLAARNSKFFDKNDGVRKEMIEAFGAVVRAINNTAIKARSQSLDARRTKAYWGTGIEMSARSFERYVIAKLHDQGFSNDYLANVVSEDYWKAADALGIGEGGSYPYPTESELPTIRAGFDQFFTTIESRETENGNVQLFSNLDPIENPVGSAVNTAQLSKAVRAMTSNWKNGPRVEVVDQGLASNATAEGYYDPNTQTVTLVAPNIRGNAKISAMDRALQVLAHETVGHYGIEAITGPKLWAQITDTIGNMRQNPKHSELFNEIDRRNKNLKPTDAAYVKEVVAVITEKGVRNSVVDRVIAAFRSFFRKLGGFKSFSEAELRQHIVKAARFVVDGDQSSSTQQDAEFAFSNPNRSAFKDAADFAKNIKAFIAGQLPGTAALTVADGTPDVYRKLGAFDLPITIKREKINDILKEHPEMNLSVFQQLGRHIHEPVAVFESKTGQGLVALTEMEVGGKPIVAAVHLGVIDGRAKVNRISTVYGRDNTAKIQKWVDEGLLRYIDNTKKPKWLTTTGLQLPNVGPTKGRLLTDQDIVKPFSSGNGYYSNPVSVAEQDQTDTPEFKKWFGDSKVVDAYGKPLIVYHGTRKSFAIFKTPSWFAQSEKFAQTFVGGGRRSSGQSRDGSQVVPIYLSINNPFDVGAVPSLSYSPTLREWLKRAGASNLSELGFDSAMLDKVVYPQELAETETYRKAFESLGYDGLVGHETRPFNEGLAVGGKPSKSDEWINSRTWAAFQPEQIKSATGNSGAFAPENPNILFSNPDPANSRQSSQVVKDIEDIMSGNESAKMLEKAKDWLKDLTPEKVKNQLRQGWLTFLTTRHITELGSDYFDGIKYYTEYLAKMGADRNQLQEEGEKVAESTRKWVGKNQAEAKRLFKVMHDATIEGADPAEDYKVLQFSYNSKLIDATKANVNKAIKEIQQQMRERSGDSKQDMLNEIKELKALPGIEKRRAESYPSMHARFKALPEEAKAIYKEFRDMYRKRSDQMEEALIARIKDTDVPDQQKRKVSDLIRKQFESARLQGVYFPLQRFGNYFVSAEKDGENVYLMFSKQTELEKAVAGLKAKEYTIKAQGLKVESKKQDAPSGTFVAQVINALGKAKISEETQDQIYQIYLQALPELSMRKHSIHRQAVVGNDPDALRAFAFNMQHGAHQLAKLRYSHKLTAVLDLLKKSQEFKREQPDADTAKVVAGDAILGELNKRHDWIMNPQDSALTNTISSAGFLYYLGATPAAALVNLTQTAMITYPYLAARFGAIKAMNHLLRAGRDSGKTLGNMQKTLTDPEEIRFYEELQKTGALDKTQAHNLAGIAEGGAVGHNPAWAKAMEIIGWGFHKTEVINREASGMAAFRLARAEGMEFDDALKTAIDTISDTHYDYTNQNRARFMQSGTAKVLLMFRQYSLNTTWHLGRMVWQATKGQTPEVRKIARRNLVGVLGMSSIFSGVLGLPTISVAFGVLNAIASTFGDDDEPWDAETEFKNFLADMFGADTARVIGSGVANEVTGADIANRVSLSQLWFRDADKELEGAGAYYYLLEQAAGPMGGILKNVLVGKQRIDEGQYWRGIETMLPKGLKDTMKAARYAQEGVNNLRGDPLIHDISLYQTLLQLNGFTPKEVAQRYEENNAVKNYEEAIMHRRQRLMDAYAMAVRLDDNGAAKDVLRKIENFNKDQPTVAISGKNIAASMRARLRYSQKAENGIVVNRKLQAKLEERVRFAGE